MSAPAFATNSLADPPASSVIAAALGWVESALLGTVATIVALLAVSAIGFMMLAGRIDLRRGLAVILGSFILFGGHAIVAGVRSSPGQMQEVEFRQLPPAVDAPGPTPATSPIGDFDPYAGASVARP